MSNGERIVVVVLHGPWRDLRFEFTQQQSPERQPSFIYACTRMDEIIMGVVDSISDAPNRDDIVTIEVSCAEELKPVHIEAVPEASC